MLLTHKLSLLAVTDTQLRDHEALNTPIQRQHLHFLHSGGDGAQRAWGVGLLVDTSHIDVHVIESAVPARQRPYMQLYDVHGPRCRMHLCVVYIPPRMYGAPGAAQARAMLDAIGRMATTYADTLVVAGDLNCHLSEASNRGGSRKGHKRETNAPGRIVETWLPTHGLHIYNGDQRFSPATPTYDSAARDAATGAPRYSTLVDYIVAGNVMGDGMQDVYTVGVHKFVSTDHRMVVLVANADVDEIKDARVSAFLAAERRSSRLPGIVNPAWDKYRLAVDARLAGAWRHVFGTRLGELPRHHVNLERAIRKLQSILLRAKHLLFEDPLPATATPPPTDALVAARHAVAQADANLHRLQQAQEREAADTAAVSTAIAVAKEAHRALQREKHAHARAVRGAKNAAATTALNSKWRTQRDQKWGHNQLMGRSRWTQRHNAGACNTMPDIVDPETGELHTTDDGKATGFTNRLKQVHSVPEPRKEDVEYNAAIAAAVDPLDASGELGLNADFTVEEVLWQIFRLKLHVSGGQLKLNANFLRGGRRPPDTPPRAGVPQPDRLALWLSTLFTLMLRQQRVPAALVKGVVTFIKKPHKDDYSKTTAWRPITVASVFCKLFEGCIETRIRRVLECGGGGLVQHLDEGQYGFRHARSCADPVFILTELRRMAAADRITTSSRYRGSVQPCMSTPDPHGMLQRDTAAQTASQVVSLDLASAFDKAQHEPLFRRLAEAGITGRIWGLLRAIYAAHTRVVKIGTTLAPPLDVNSGVPQGFLSSPLLFICLISVIANAVKKAMRLNRVDYDSDFDFSSPPPIEVEDDGKTITAIMGPVVLLAYADDLQIAAHSTAHLTLALQAIAHALDRIGAEVNLGKTYQLVSNRMTIVQRWWVRDDTGNWVQGPQLQTTTSLKRSEGRAYLGVTVDHAGTLAAHRTDVFKRTITAYNRCGTEVSSHGVYNPRLGKLCLPFATGHLLFCSEAWSRGSGPPATLETAQARACARVLEMRGAPRLYVLGELGFTSIKAKLYKQRMAYWLELLLQPPTRYTRWVYQQNLATYNSGYNGLTWARETHTMLTNMADGVGEEAEAAATAWCNGNIQQQREWAGALVGEDLPTAVQMLAHTPYIEWRRRVRDVAAAWVDKWDECQWRHDVQQSHTLQLFAKLHPTRCFARYLDCCHRPAATKMRARLRAGMYPLQTREAYWHHRNDMDSQAYRDAAACPLCHDAPETVTHFVLHCPALDRARRDQHGRTLQEALLAECHSPPVLQQLQPDPHGAVDDEVALALALGGDLTTRHADLEDFMQPRSVADRAGLHPHPARDRLKALNITAPILLALGDARTALLAPTPEADNNTATPAPTAAARAHLANVLASLPQ